MGSKKNGSTVTKRTQGPVAMGDVLSVIRAIGSIAFDNDEALGDFWESAQYLQARDWHAAMLVNGAIERGVSHHDIVRLLIELASGLASAADNRHLANEMLSQATKLVNMQGYMDDRAHFESVGMATLYDDGDCYVMGIAASVLRAAIAVAWSERANKESEFASDYSGATAIIASAALRMVRDAYAHSMLFDANDNFRPQLRGEDDGRRAEAFSVVESLVLRLQDGLNDFGRATRLRKAG